MRHEAKEFTQKLISLILPITFQQFMLALVSASDALMLGMISQNALSAVSLASQITCPRKAPKGLMRHSNKLGNLVKDINRLMKVKRELNEIMELSNRLFNADALCAGSCNAALEELSEYYDVSEYANIVKNYIIYFLFVKFKLCQRDFHKKIGLSVKGNHDRAEKYIDLFKADSEKIFRPFITARADDMFSVTKSVRCQTDIFDSSIYKIHTDNGNIRLFVANDSFITLLDTYVDIMSDAGRLVTNCENCGQLMITNRANASLTCGRST